MHDEIYFRHADKHWRFLPFDLVCVIRHAQNNQNKFAYLWNISREKCRMKLIFSLQNNTKLFYTLIISLECTKVDMPKELQTISLQYLCNISKKKLKMKSIFCLLINAKSFSKVIQPFSVCVASHVQITQYNKLTISLQYLTHWFQQFGYQSFLQGDTIIIDGYGQAFSNYSK